MAAITVLLSRLANSARSLWRLRSFRRFWLANIISNLGTSAFVMALSWLTVKSYGATGIALLALGYGVPQFLLEVIGGAEADRMNRLHLFRLTEIGLLVVALILWCASLVGAVPLWLLVGLTAANGAISAFDSPARNALISEMVPGEELVDADQLYSMSSSITNIFGPALGGILMSIGPTYRSHEEVAFLFNLLSFLPLIIVLPYLPLKDSSVASGDARRESFVKSISEGLSFVRGDRALKPLLQLLAALTLLGMPFQALLPIFVDGHHSWGGDQGHGVYAFLLSSVGFGGFLGSLLGMVAGEALKPGRALFIAASALAFSILLLASSDALLAAFLAALCAGACGIFVVNLDMALVEGLTPPELQGRVSAIASLGKGLQSFSAAAASGVIHLINVSCGALSLSYVIVQCALAVVLIFVVLFLRCPLLSVVNSSYGCNRLI
jgi:MFS family permease